MKKLWRSATVLTCLLVLALGMTVCAAEATILKGITIEGVDVSGMTKDQAISALEAYETKLGEEILKLKIGNNELDAPLSSFGVTYSNEDAVTSALRVGRTGNIVKRYKDQKDLQHSGMNYTLSRQANKEMVKVGPSVAAGTLFESIGGVGSTSRRGSLSPSGGITVVSLT